jgi:hypothetical protein
VQKLKQKLPQLSGLATESPAESKMPVVHKPEKPAAPKTKSSSAAKKATAQKKSKPVVNRGKI